MNDLAVVTIVSNNYLHFARTLLQSVARQMPDADRFCVIVDTDLSYAQELRAEFDTIRLDQLHLPDGDDFLFQYTVLELNTAVKPWALQHLLQRGYRQVIYLDPDIFLYRPLAALFDLFSAGAKIVLTPHLLAPLNDSYRPTELDIRRAGTYNLGFCAVAASDTALAYLHWWQEKLRRDCIVDINSGIFVDQSWMDLVPGLFDQVAILRHPGYNVAYWNLAQRVIRDSAPLADPQVNGQPLVFFHFSGFDPFAPERVSKHQNRFTFSNLPSATRRRFEDYAEQVLANNAERYRLAPYGFGCFAEGTPIQDAERHNFRCDPQLRQQCAGQPFDCASRLSLRFQDKSAISAEHQVAPLHVHRLQQLYLRLLGRLPERDALLALGPRMGRPLGMARTVLSVGLSPEARTTPGWLARLVRLVNEVQFTPRLLKRSVAEPLAWGLERSGRFWPSLAYRPPRGAEPGIAHTHVVMRPQRQAGVPVVSPLDRPGPAGINLIGYLRAELGVGEAARSLARSCVAVDIPFSATDVGYQSQNLQRDESIMALASDLRYPVDLLYVNADQTAATAQQLQLGGRQPAGYSIGFWHWEQPVVPPSHYAAFAHVDEIWVPSTFVQEAVAAVAPVPVYRVPHAIQFSPSAAACRQSFGLPEDRFLVLVMYDFHSYQYRKNPQAAIAAFRLAARSQKSLGLVIKTINGQHHPAALTELEAEVADLANVFFIHEFLTRQQTWDLQSCCDALLSLHRAEGFGLAPAEMMSLAKPVIATGWSANMDFMTVDNSLPVRYALKPLDRDLGAYPAGPLWAEADIDHAAWCLEQLVQQPDLAARLGSRAALDIQQQLHPAVVGQRIRQRLQELEYWYPELRG
ncbi:glycosyltransferase [Desulfuromonas thiophila]|uniref:Nucleotide-diphospho-sugar transferase n=1 Tax=Desulfuromonas thiophila TaxID=57664 RepID=A0A1G7EWZ3_9BACT|nr:glycosyltransferase [Desulfuromonas thiophila]SDE67966.1 Nucleotide-diphospho-sugar transferase [Desulfuromonas thiophila]